MSYSNCVNSYSTDSSIWILITPLLHKLIGPDSSRIYDEDGYDYLAEHFPNLDFIERCYIVDEEEGLVSEEL